MHGFNWVDIVIVCLVIGASIGGVRVGFLRLLCIITGVFVGLFLGGFIIPRLLWFIDDPTTLMIVNGNLVLGLAIGLGLIAGTLGRRIHTVLRKGKRLKIIEACFGVLLSACTVLAVIWLGAASIGRLPFEGLSNSANDALIVQSLNRFLPPTPTVFAGLGRLIDPSSPPKVFLSTDQQLAADTQVVQSEVMSAAQKASASTVRVTSFGCGGIVSGSGFVVAPGLIMTNAHVVAGVYRPIIKYEGDSFEGVPVYFNPGLDIAILRVHGLLVEAASLTSEIANGGATVAVLGFPSSDQLIIGGVIAGHSMIPGRNIYDVGSVGREVYQIQANIAEGTSGAPVVLANGQVIGMLFAVTESEPHVGLALTARSFMEFIEQSKSAYRQVGTGSCAAG